MTNNQYEEKGNWLQQLVTKLIVLNPPNFEKSDYKSIPKFKNKLIFVEYREYKVLIDIILLA